jgi:hypothetical protein
LSHVRRVAFINTSLNVTMSSAPQRRIGVKDAYGRPSPGAIANVIAASKMLRPASVKNDLPVGYVLRGGLP